MLSPEPACSGHDPLIRRVCHAVRWPARSLMTCVNRSHQFATCTCFAVAYGQNPATRPVPADRFRGAVLVTPRCERPARTTIGRPRQLVQGVCGRACERLCAPCCCTACCTELTPYPVWPSFHQFNALGLQYRSASHAARAAPLRPGLGPKLSTRSAIRLAPSTGTGG